MKSWREVYKVHPAADLFPMLPEDELRKLGKDIKENGLRESIVFLVGGDLIDGRNRLEAMSIAGMPIDVIARKSTVNTDDPYGFVISKNIRRRHLTKEQQADLIVKVIKAKEADLAKMAKSVERNSKGQVKGSTKNPVKQAAVEEGKKHGISKRMIERARAKDKGPTQKKPSKTDTKTIVKASEKMKLQQDIDAGWVTPERAQRITERIEKQFSGVPDIKIGEPIEAAKDKPQKKSWSQLDTENIVLRKALEEKERRIKGLEATLELTKETQKNLDVLLETLQGAIGKADAMDFLKALRHLAQKYHPDHNSLDKMVAVAEVMADLSPLFKVLPR